MFDVFDPDSDRGRVYQVLVSAPRSSVAAIAQQASLPETTVRNVLVELQQSSAVVSLDAAKEIWDAKRPDVVADEVLRRFGSWRARLHETEQRLTDAFRYARCEGTVVDTELVEGPELFERYRKIQESARRQVLSIDRPPYYWDESEIARQVQLQVAQMADGVEYRTIYQESEGDSPVRSATMTRAVANGESARVLAHPPVKLTIVDDVVGIIALDPPPGAEGRLVAILVHRSALLGVLCNIFESMWSLAVPVNLDEPNQAIGKREKEILVLMASGAGDDAIARRLGVSRRTVVRHIGRLLEQLGATTRFQAGAQATRRGWL